MRDARRLGDRAGRAAPSFAGASGGMTGAMFTPRDGSGAPA